MGEPETLRDRPISVVIPTYDRWTMLHRALDSVVQQSLQPSEIIVVDDGSSAALPRNLQAVYPRVIWMRQENLGVAAARNLGIGRATGEWIALLDSDDEWAPDKLEEQMKFLSTHPSCRAVHTNEKWIRNGNEVMPPEYLDKSPDDLWERSLKRCLICPSSVLLHRSVFEIIGLFDTSLPVCEDYDYWLRLLLQMEIGLVSKKLVIKHGGHPDQLSTTTWGMDRFRALSLKKLLKNPDMPATKRSIALDELHEKCVILAKGARKRGREREARSYEELSGRQAKERPEQTVETQ